MKVSVVRNVLEANDRIAIQNRKSFDDFGVKVINMMSGPGAGKTTLIAETIRSLKHAVEIAVIEGDIQSTHDAEIIATTGAQVVQINTGGACHLDANMVSVALAQIDLTAADLLIIENVGNLVCPADFKLGEDCKVMLLSVTEGDDKPLKYPLMFQESSVLLINKIDLLPYIDCDVEKIKTDARSINPSIEIFEVSAKTKSGLEGWYAWLRSKASSTKTAPK
ncbi:MAG: hydrogenase accessory protein HypB [Desulfobacteraceae bacterium]|nr:MAG: hydrogenase accessory protein HypB [Desulfobacteraceae bacterium]